MNCPSREREEGRGQERQSLTVGGEGRLWLGRRRSWAGSGGGDEVEGFDGEGDDGLGRQWCGRRRQGDGGDGAVGGEGEVEGKDLAKF